MSAAALAAAMTLAGSVAMADDPATQTVTITVVEASARTITTSGTVAFTVQAGAVLLGPDALTATSRMSFRSGESAAKVSVERDDTDLARLRLEVPSLELVDADGCIEGNPGADADDGGDRREDDGTDCSFSGGRTGGWNTPDTLSWTGEENARFIIWPEYASPDEVTNILTWQLIGGANVSPGNPLPGGEITTAFTFLIEDADVPD